MLTVNNIEKSFFGSGKLQLAVIDKISFTVKSGKITAIFGPNGCGKTTLLKIIAGLISSDKGSIELNNKSSEKNKIGFVFQNYSSSLFPWWKVWENIGLNLKIKGILSVDIKRQVENLLVKTGIALPLENYPYVLSGGQQQLCAILRELINSPALLLAMMAVIWPLVVRGSTSICGI